MSENPSGSSPSDDTPGSATDLTEYWENYWCWTCLGKGKISGASEAWNWKQFPCPDCGGTGRSEKAKHRQGSDTGDAKDQTR